MILTGVDSYPVDSSPYDVRGMAGNVMEWCLDKYLLQGPEVRDNRVVIPQWDDIQTPGDRVFRGGSAFHSPRNARLDYQGRNISNRQIVFIGFRVVYSLLCG